MPAGPVIKGLIRGKVFYLLRVAESYTILSYLLGTHY